jgi:hypothetical protein
MPTFEQFLSSADGGWNWVSFPYKVADTSMPNVMLPLVAGVDWDIAEWWDPVTTTWLDWASFKPPPLRTLTYLDFRRGFYIHALRDCTMSITGDLCTITDTIPMIAGLNYVGYPRPSKPDYTIAQAKLETGATVIQGCTPPCHTIAPLADGVIMKVGEAYCFEMAGSHTWIEWYASGIRNVQLKNTTMRN